MTYRDSAKPAPKIVESFDIATAQGATATGILLAMVIIFLVAWGVSIFGGTPRELEGWVWTFPVGAALFTVPTVWIWHRRKRKLHVVRDGDDVKLVVDGEVELTFPLTLSGMQYTEHMRGVPIYHVTLKLVGKEDRGIVFRETRGAIHGPLSDWFEEVDKTTPAVAYEVTSGGQVAKIRWRVDGLNRHPDVD